MSKLGKKVSDKLDDAATRVILVGDKVAGDVGAKAANVVCGAVLGRYWQECTHEDCDCREFGIRGQR
ncbi:MULTISPECIES: hypothetical protein [unclassified Streptomyces]|uniref:hypothetical protein n=1 Tax=unclassified Streptomyces TaxID=2593676 RepID=UPI003320A22C